MSIDQPPGGRRSNGLPSADWGALVDLDPRLSEALLSSLAAVGVAAYVEPAGGTDTLHRAVLLPKRPLDRLWVDAGRADEARAVVGAEVAELTALLAEEEPGATAHGFVQPVPRTAASRVLKPPVLPDPPARSSAPEEDPDEAWRQIVDGWTKESTDPVPPWPVSEDVDPSAPAPPAPSAPREPRRLRRREDEADDALPSWVEPEALDDEGHYVPPPPPPIPKPKRHTTGSVVALVLGLVLVFAPELLGQVRSTGLGLLGIVLMGGGAGMLVWHMRDAPPTDRGPDDGAVV